MKKSKEKFDTLIVKGEPKRINQVFSRLQKGQGKRLSVYKAK